MKLTQVAVDCQTHLTSHLPCWLHVPEISKSSLLQEINFKELYSCQPMPLPFKITFSFMYTWTQHRLLQELKTSWKTFSAFEEAGVSTWPCCAAMRCKTVDFWKIYCIKKLVLQLKETKVDNSNQDPTCMESWCAKRHKSSASIMGGTLYVSS